MNVMGLDMREVNDHGDLWWAVWAERDGKPASSRRFMIFCDIDYAMMWVKNLNDAYRSPKDRRRVFRAAPAIQHHASQPKQASILMFGRTTQAHR